MIKGENENRYLNRLNKIQVTFKDKQSAIDSLHKTGIELIEIVFPLSDYLWKS